MEDFYYEDFYYDVPMSDEVFANVFAILLGVLGVVLLVGILFYVLQSLAVYTVAKRRGIKNPGLAWVPVANYWIMGCISDQYKYVVKGKVQNRRTVMLALQIAAVVLSILASVLELFLPALGVILSVANYGVAIASMVIWYMALYDLYSSCNPDNSVLFLVLSILLGVTMPFFMFACRNKDKGMPPRKPVQPAYQPTAGVQWQPIPEAPASEPAWQPAEPPKEPWENNPEE